MSVFLSFTMYAFRQQVVRIIIGAKFMDGQPAARHFILRPMLVNLDVSDIADSFSCGDALYEACINMHMCLGLHTDVYHHVMYSNGLAGCLYQPVVFGLTV